MKNKLILFGLILLFICPVLALPMPPMINSNLNWSAAYTALANRTNYWGPYHYSSYNMPVILSFAYNQTTPFTNWLNGFAYNYNQTLAANTYSDSQDIIFNNSMTDYVDIQVAGAGGGNLSFNQTLTNSLYADIQWAYNQSESIWHYNMSDGTGNGNLSFNQTLTDTLYSNIKWNYNQTYSGSTYNSTYSVWAYNMTTPFTTWLNGFAYNYNQSISIWHYNQTTPAITYCQSNFNYTAIIANITTDDCPADTYLYGFNADGTPKCRNNGLNSSVSVSGGVESFPFIDDSGLTDDGTMFVASVIDHPDVFVFHSGTIYSVGIICDGAPNTCTVEPQINVTINSVVTNNNVLLIEDSTVGLNYPVPGAAFDAEDTLSLTVNNYACTTAPNDCVAQIGVVYD